VAFIQPPNTGTDAVKKIDVTALIRTAKSFFEIFSLYNKIPDIYANIIVPILSIGNITALSNLPDRYVFMTFDAANAIPVREA
jgi:hypothetical protein